MNQRIRSVQIVSDGVIVVFSDGAAVYFSADFLDAHVGCGSNQLLLDYDPSPKEMRSFAIVFPSAPVS